MSILQNAGRILSLFEDKRAITALFFWPKFSLTSFLMVSRLARQGILPATVIDVGANVGQFAVASAKTFPNVTVHCFEPNPESVVLLNQNVRSLTNVHVHPIALGDTVGEVEFHVNAYSPSSSILALAKAHKKAFPAAQEKTTITVKSSRLDDVLAGVHLAPPILLKIDVQGYEARVLAGAEHTMERVDQVIIETSFVPMYEGEAVFEEVVSIMKDRNYFFARPIDFSTAYGTNEIVQVDGLFVRNSLHNRR